MKIITLFFLFFPLLLFSQESFEKHFTKGSLRVDFLLAGNYQTTNAYLQSLKREPYWGGSRTNLIDTLGYGSDICKVWSVDSGELIYSHGFCTLFQEWQSTPEAKTVNRGFYQTVSLPFPKETVRFEIFERDKKGLFNKILSVIIDPLDYSIKPPSLENYKTLTVLKSGDPSHCLDVVFLPEGYTKTEMKKFVKDIQRLCDSLFSVPPFREFKDRFNLTAVLSPSEDKGTDIPGKGLWKNTIMNSSFYTFNIERYLTTFDYWKVRDLASLVPYDQICILVNTKDYGGGGIYNHYNLSSAGHKLSPEIFIHEFGHSFGALGDEYYTSDVAYNAYYPLDVEPWEPNLTTLVNFDKKWKSSLSPGTPVPTDNTEPYNKGLGVFEGGGYSAKGIYRPQSDCLMKSNQSKSFCIVCRNIIEKMIHSIID